MHNTSTKQNWHHFVIDNIHTVNFTWHGTKHLNSLLYKKICTTSAFHIADEAIGNINIQQFCNVLKPFQVTKFEIQTLGIPIHKLHHFLLQVKLSVNLTSHNFATAPKPFPATKFAIQTLGISIYFAVKKIKNVLHKP